MCVCVMCVCICVYADFKDSADTALDSLSTAESIYSDLVNRGNALQILANQTSAAVRVVVVVLVSLVAVVVVAFPPRFLPHP